MTGVQEAAKQYVPELRSKGADLVVALSHGAGAAALDASFAAIPASANVDAVNGFVNGVPTVMAQSWGRRLGIIKMTLAYQGGKWVVQPGKTTVESRGFKYKDGATNVAADPSIGTIVNLSYQGKAIADSDDFIVATNDYRAGDGGSVPGIDGSKTIIKLPDANQAVVSNYLQKLGTTGGKVTLAANGSARSWSFVKTTTAGPVILRSAPGHLALAKSAGINVVTAEGGLDASGFAKYAIDLSK